MVAASILGLIYFGGFLAILAAIGFVVYLKKYKHSIDITRDIPSPPSLPLIGHGHYFVGRKPHENVHIFQALLEKYGPVYKIWLGPELNIMTNDVKDVEVILSTTRFNDKAHEYETLEPWLKEGLLISRGRKWHLRRKALTPAFHFKILDNFIDVFERQSRLLLTNLDKEYRMQTDKGVELYDWVNLSTLDTICGKRVFFYKTYGNRAN